jgi:hypothetical protein
MKTRENNSEFPFYITESNTPLRTYSDPLQFLICDPREDGAVPNTSLHDVKRAEQREPQFIFAEWLNPSSMRSARSHAVGGAAGF